MAVQPCMYWIPIRKKCWGRLANQYYPIALPFFEEIGSCQSYFQIHMLYFTPLSVNEISLHYCKSNIRLLLVESSVIVIFYMFFLCAQATEFGGNDRAITLSSPLGFVKVNDLSLPQPPCENIFC